MNDNYPLGCSPDNIPGDTPEDRRAERAAEWGWERAERVETFHEWHNAITDHHIGCMSQVEYETILRYNPNFQDVIADWKSQQYGWKSQQCGGE